MSESSLTLSWRASDKDGGSKIIEYIVETKETSQETWRRCGATIGDYTNIHIENLVKDQSYEFRICARNEAGTSAYLETEDKIIVGRNISEYPNSLTLEFFFSFTFFEMFYFEILFFFTKKNKFFFTLFFTTKFLIAKIFKFEFRDELLFCFTSGWSTEECK